MEPDLTREELQHNKMNEDHLTKEEMRLRKKQSECHHFSYKCSCCGLYKDNLHNEYARTISHLLKIIEVYEKALDVESPILIEYKHYVH